MKFNLIIIVLFALTLVFVSCENDVQPTQAIADQTSDEALWLETQSLEKPLTGWQTANEELSERFLAAFAAKDLDGVMDCFWNSPDLVLVLENGFVVRGWDNVRFGVEMMLNSHDAVLLEVNEVSRFRLGANVYSVGTATWTRTANGVSTSFVETWTDVAKKVNGKWVYIMDHAHDLTPFAQPLP